MYSDLLGVLYYSQATNRSEPGGGGSGGSRTESSLLPIDRMGVIYNYQLHDYTFLYTSGLGLNINGVVK